MILCRCSVPTDDVPFDDPTDEGEEAESPECDCPAEEVVDPRLDANEDLEDNKGRTEQEIEESLATEEAKSRAVVLEMIGDIPDADVKPPGAHPYYYY